MDERRFRWTLTALLLVGLVVRLAVALALGPDEIQGIGDGSHYHLQANLIADGRPFVHPEPALLGAELPDAQHPPLFSLVLAAPSALGLGTATTHQVAGVAIGTAGALLVALLARKVGGDRAGLVAAALALLYPALWVHEALVLSESLLVLVTAAVLLAALRFRDRPSAVRAAAVGALLALAALTRTEQVLLAALVGGWVAVQTRRNHEVLRPVGAMAGMFLLLLAPWVAWNLTRFDEPTLVSTQLGVTEAVASCDATFEGDRRGLSELGCGYERLAEVITEQTDAETAAAYVTIFSYQPDLADHPITGDATSITVEPELCVAAFPTRPETAVTAARCRDAVLEVFEQVDDASAVDRDLSREARTYVGDHKGQLPAVAATRVAALWGAYPPSRHVDFDVAVDNRPRPLAWAAWIGFYALLPLAVLGALAVRRRRGALFLLLTPAIVATVTAAAFFGSVRFRAGADVSLVVLAAVGVVEIWALLRPAPAASPEAAVD